MTNMQRFRQGLILSGLVLCTVSDGFIFGQMSGMIAALRDQNSPLKLSDDDISTIAATINITCFCGFALMVGLTEFFGRRKSLTIVSIPVLICWLMVYFANEKIMLIASRAIVGLSYGGILVLTYINVGEYVSPNMRSLSLNFMSGIGSSFGTMLGHVLCIFLHWRNVALIGLVPTALSAFIPLFWVESPSWLAVRNRFDECEQAFKALHVHSQESERELKMLLNLKKQNHNSKQPNRFRELIRQYIEACKNKYYWKIVILMLAICLYRVAAGKVLLNTLAISIIQDITGTTDILGYTLVVDGFALIGSGISCVLVTRFKMRPLLFFSGITSNIIQLLFALSLYLWQDQHMAWVKISLLALYYITVTAGPYSVLETLLTELHPLEIKTVNCVLMGAIFSVIQFLHVQFATKMFATIGNYGVFFLNSCIVFLCLFYIYLQLPETKDRTLQEIELYFKHNTFKYETSDVDYVSDKINAEYALEPLNSKLEV